MKAAVIGAGRMGQCHIEVLRSLNLELAGICDSRPESVSRASAKYGLSPDICYTVAADMLREVRPECVVVATTAPSHCDLTCLAADAGAMAVLCEKPLARSLVECRRMIDTCHARGTRLAVNHQMRFMEQYTKPKQIVQSSLFGKLASITVLGGNFGLAMNATHYFEMFRFMTDAPPAEVMAWFSDGKVPNPRGSQFEDRAGCVRLVGQNGVRFYLDASSDQGHGFMTIYAGRNGQLMVDEATGDMRLSMRESAYLDAPTTRYLMPFNITSLRIERAEVLAPTRAVMKALLAGENYPTGVDGANAVRVLVAAYVSHDHGGCSIRLDDPRLDEDREFPWA